MLAKFLKWLNKDENVSPIERDWRRVKVQALKELEQLKEKLLC